MSMLGRSRTRRGEKKMSFADCWICCFRWWMTIQSIAFYSSFLPFSSCEFLFYFFKRALWILFFYKDEFQGSTKEQENFYVCKPHKTNQKSKNSNPMNQHGVYGAAGFSQFKSQPTNHYYTTFGFSWGFTMYKNYYCLRAQWKTSALTQHTNSGTLCVCLFRQDYKKMVYLHSFNYC